MLLLLAATAGGGEMPVPVATQFPLLLKILTADRNLSLVPGRAVPIGIVYESSLPASVEARNALLAAITRPPADGAPRVTPLVLDVDQPNALATLRGPSRPAVLYIAPLGRFPVKRVVAASRALKILTVTGVPRYVADGLSVGFEARNGAVRILVNRKAGRAEGADFSSKLLKLADVVE